MSKILSDENYDFKGVKKDLSDAVKGLKEGDSVLLLVQKDGANAFEKISGSVNDMMVARFIRDALDESEAMQTLVKYLELKDRENRPSFGDMLSHIAGLSGYDDE